MKRIAPLDEFENRNNNNEILIPGTYENSELTFSNKLLEAMQIDNFALFYHPKAGGVKSILQKSLIKNGILIKEEKHFLCNFRNVLEVADKIKKQNFVSILYVIDQSKSDISLHQKDKLFYAISEKFRNLVKIIINNNIADIYDL